MAKKLNRKEILSRDDPNFYAPRDPDTRYSTSRDKDRFDLIGVDSDLSLFDLTDLFYMDYKYHNEMCLTEFTETTVTKNKITNAQKTLPRFPVLRRLEAAALGTRPFINGTGISVTRPNPAFGYFKMFLNYLILPYKSLFTDSSFVSIKLNQKLYDETKLSDKDLEQIKFEAANSPNIPQNAEISSDVTAAYIDVTNTSKRYRKCKEQIPIRLAQDGLAIMLHCDIDWAPIPINPLDLVTEPQCEWDAENWNHYFVIQKMPAQELIRHIREDTPFWNTDALRWALESSLNNRGVLNRNHYDNSTYSAHEENMCAENFMVRSFYHDKASRRTNIGSYYGYLYVVKAVYVNKEGSVNTAIFFPSIDFRGTAADVRARFNEYKAGRIRKNSKDIPQEMRGADVLFFRKNVFPDMRRSITVIPSDRSEPTLERQRNYGHSLFSICEAAMRIDSALLNLANIIGTPLYKNRLQGADAQSLEDLELEIGEINDIGDRDLVALPWTVDLNALGSVRSILLRQAADLSYLGGLDGQELKGNARDKDLVGLQLVKDARVHKHKVEDFAIGLQDANEVVFKRIIDMKDDALKNDPLIKYRFFETLEQVHGHDLDVFDYKEREVLPETNLPYWMSLHILRNGASYFGASEIILFQELKSLVGETLDQTGIQNMNRIIIKKLLDQQDAMDVLGDKDLMKTADQDQIYRSRIENGALIAGVLSGYQNFEDIPILPDKDNHLLHLTEGHLPKMEGLLQALQEGEVTPQALQELTEDTLETRSVMILQLGALMNHTTQHLDMLDRFGAQRSDIAELKEHGNYIVQAAESLLNNLQRNLRALAEKREAKEQRLRGMSPENEIKRQEIEVELQKLAVSKEKDMGNLMLANKIAELKQVQHLDKQVSKARDRELKREIASANQQNTTADRQIYQQEVDNELEGILAKGSEL